MDAQTLGFGIVGCGGISAVHIAAIDLLPGAALVGVADRDIACARQTAQTHHTRVFASFADMLASPDVDIVSLCTPSGLHAPMTLEALKAGKHVVVEKPLALTLPDADAVIAQADASDRKVCVISQLRFSPAVQAVSQALAGGQLGRVVSARLTMHYWRSPQYYGSSPWRGTWAMDGGGALMNQGIHGVDLMLYLLGPVRRLSALTKTQTHAIETEDTAAALLEFASGAVGTLQASTTCHPGYPRTLEICGDGGSVVLREDSILSWDLPGEAPETLHAQGNPAQDHKAIHPEGHRIQLENMINAVQGKEPLLVDAREGRKPLALILAVYESARQGTFISPA